MRQILVPAFLVVLTPLTAQEAAMPGPAEQVAAFDKLLGSWEGEGRAWMAPGADPLSWTARGVARKVLGGHFVRDDVRIEFAGEQAPPALVFRTFYGYDAQTKRYTQHSVDNMGGAASEQIHWVDGKMLTGGGRTQIDPMSGEKQFVVERWSTAFTEDGYKIAGYQAVGNGKPFLHVAGTFTRSKVANASMRVQKAGAASPVAKPMQPLHKFAGTYRMQGWMVMQPGMPKTQIGATERVAPLFGGAAVEFELVGDPVPGMGVYKGWGATTWSDVDGCYKQLWIDNMGQASLVDGYLREGKLISCASMVVGGEPRVTRSILTLGDDGGLRGITEHKTIGAHGPTHTFEASYQRKSK